MNRRPSTARRSCLPWLATFALLVPGAATAAFLDLYVDPEQSRIELVSGSFDVLLAPGLNVVLAAEAQTGVAGTVPGTLPGGGTSDGLETSLSGTILAEIDSFSTQLEVHTTSTTVDADHSGVWAPGPAGAAGVAAADLAFQVQDVVLGLDVVTALRDVQIALGSTFSLTPDGPDAWIASGWLEIYLASGTVDYDSAMPGLTGTGVLQPGRAVGYGTYVADGRYEIVEPGLTRLTLPFSTGPIVFLADEGGTAIPATVTGSIQGTVVAQSQPLPEPTVGAGLFSGVLGIGWMARRRRRREALR